MPAEKKPARSKKVEEEIVPAEGAVEPITPVEAVVAAPVPPQPVAPVVPVAASAGVKPGMVQAIAIMTLVNGIFNILWGFGLTGSIVLGTVGFGIICSPFTVLPLVLGIFEVIYAAKLLANPPQPVQPSQTIAILEICCVLTGNAISLVVGILALVFYSDGVVKNYFAKINGQA